MTDLEIFEIYKRKPREAFRLIMDKYQEMMYWYVRKKLISHQDTDDVIQNVFISVWKNLGSFRGEAKFKTWIYRIATNEIYDFYKKSKRYKIDPIDHITTVLKTESSLGYYDGDEIETLLFKAIDTLPPKQKQVFHLKYFEDLKYTEIQNILGGSIGSLKASYHHAVQKVKDRISETEV